MRRISKQQLLKLQTKHNTDQAIGGLFGISRQAIHQLRIAYGIEKINAKHKDRNDAIINAYKDGMSGIKLSKLYKISISQTYRIIRNSQLPQTSINQKS